MEPVKVGLSVPCSIVVEVDNPQDADEVIKAMIERIDENPQELIDNLQTEALGENVHFVDTLEGEVIHEW